MFLFKKKKNTEAAAKPVTFDDSDYQYSDNLDYVFSTLSAMAAADEMIAFGNHLYSRAGFTERTKPEISTYANQDFIARNYLAAVIHFLGTTGGFAGYRNATGIKFFLTLSFAHQLKCLPMATAHLWTPMLDYYEKKWDKAQEILNFLHLFLAPIEARFILSLDYEDFYSKVRPLWEIPAETEADKLVNTFQDFASDGFRFKGIL